MRDESQFVVQQQQKVGANVRLIILEVTTDLSSVHYYVFTSRLRLTLLSFEIFIEYFLITQILFVLKAFLFHSTTQTRLLWSNWGDLSSIIVHQLQSAT